MKIENNDELLTVTSASVILNVAAVTVRRHANSGLLPCIRNSVNGRLFKRSDVEEFKRKHRTDNYRTNAPGRKAVRS